MVAINENEYDFLRRLVYEHSRINLGADKKELVARRVHKRLRALNLPDYEAYCSLLRSPAGQEEMTDLLDVISTNVTDFFREPQHFQYLREKFLPAWLKESGGNGRVFRAWSAACSSGEEPYTLAITLAEFSRGNPALSGWRIDASDISTRMLEVGNKGVYRTERVRLPAPEWLPRYFQRGVGDADGYCRVKKDLRDRVTFHHVNLFQGSYPIAAGVDAIFCRNVMIYFDRETQEVLVNRLCQQLSPGGHLFVGHSESLIGIRHRLRSVQPSIYRLT
jgi:chemotaxis protein methyltransferase CheR